MAAQVRAGFWRKNGQSLTYIIHYYSHVRCRELMSNEDYKAMQLMAINISLKDDFLATIINTIGLNNAFLDPEFKLTDKSQTSPAMLNNKIQW